ncbi:MFS sugar transporter [Paraphaeosphaeria sporulosa]
MQTIADLHSNRDTEVEYVQKVYLEIQEAVVYEAELGKAGWLAGWWVCYTFCHSRATSLIAILHKRCSPAIVSARTLALLDRCLLGSSK